MKMFILEPEVAGEMGDNSKIIYKNGMIDKVEFLHYEFEGWLGDEILTTTPCFIVSESISKDIIASDLIGYKFEDIQISKSEEYLEKIEMHPELNLPNFKRLVPLRNMTIDNNKITGYTEGNDFFMANGLDLVVSQNALEILKKHKMNYCEISELNC